MAIYCCARQDLPENEEGIKWHPFGEEKTVQVKHRKLRHERSRLQVSWTSILIRFVRKKEFPRPTAFITDKNHFAPKIFWLKTTAVIIKVCSSPELKWTVGAHPKESLRNSSSIKWYCWGISSAWAGLPVRETSRKTWKKKLKKESIAKNTGMRCKNWHLRDENNEQKISKNIFCGWINWNLTP